MLKLAAAMVGSGSHQPPVEELGLEGIGGLEVGEGDGEGVGGVGWRGFGEAEQGPDHEGDLAFVGGALADDGHLDFARGVFVDRQSVVGGGTDRRDSLWRYVLLHETG